MKKILVLAALLSGSFAQAGDVSIVFAELTKRVGSWNVAVTLKHADSGWDHYANGWQIVDEGGKVLGKRVLAHPHVHEQPFTRNLYEAKIPANTKVVYIEATDSVHGKSPDRLRVDLSKSAETKRYKVSR